MAPAEATRSILVAVADQRTPHCILGDVDTVIAMALDLNDLPR